MRLDRVVGAYHAGRIINPKIAGSQAFGGIIWETGQALLEKSEADRVMGRFLNGNHPGYLVPPTRTSEADVVFTGDFDHEARLLGPKIARRADRRVGSAPISPPAFTMRPAPLRDLPLTVEKPL